MADQDEIEIWKKKVKNEYLRIRQKKRHKLKNSKAKTWQKNWFVFFISYF